MNACKAPSRLHLLTSWFADHPHRVYLTAFMVFEGYLSYLSMFNDNIGLSVANGTATAIAFGIFLFPGWALNVLCRNAVSTVFYGVLLVWCAVLVLVWTAGVPNVLAGIFLTLGFYHLWAGVKLSHRLAILKPMA